MRVLEALVELDRLKGWTTIAELASVSEEKKLRVTQELNLNKSFINVDPNSGKISLKKDLHHQYPDRYYCNPGRQVVSSSTGKIEMVAVIGAYYNSNYELPNHLYENIGKELTFDYLTPSRDVFAVRDTPGNRQALRDRGLLHYSEFRLHDFWEEGNPELSPE